MCVIYNYMIQINCELTWLSSRDPIQRVLTCAASSILQTTHHTAFTGHSSVARTGYRRVLRVVSSSERHAASLSLPRV